MSVMGSFGRWNVAKAVGTTVAMALSTGTWSDVFAEAKAGGSGDLCSDDAEGQKSAGPRDLLDPKMKGVELLDLPHLDGQAVGRFLRLKGVIPANEILATAIVEQYEDRIIADVVARAARFRDSDDKLHKHGRTGVLRVSVPLGALDGLSDIGEPEILWQKSLADISLQYRVSVAEWVGVLTDDSIGFRRVLPLGGGAIDRGVRVPHVLTSLTPTFEDAVLDKKYSWRELNNPWYFRSKPYIPIAVGRSWTRPDGTVHRFYTESNIAFHIWQSKGFERGFFSRGCMRMRTDDLMELAAYVFGADKPIPVKVRIPVMPDADHPHPTKTDIYWEILNYGTAEKPRYLLEYGQLYKTGLGTTPLPRLEDLRALDFREKPVEAIGWDTE
jgi:hypothetical protein